MLQSIRDKIQGWIAIAISIAIAMIFSLWGVQNYRGNKGRVVAKVDGKEIFYDQVQFAYDQEKHLATTKKEKNFILDKKSQLKLKSNALQRLIDEQILLGVGAKMGLGSSNEQLWGIVSSLPIFRDENGFSPGLYRRAVGRVFYSEASFLDSLKGMMIRSHLEGGIAKSNFVLPNEIGVIKSSLGQHRDYGYFFVPFKQFEGSAVIDATSIEKYFDDHQNEFLTPEMVSIQYLELLSKEFEKVDQASEQVLKSYYDNNLGFFTTPKRWKLLKVTVPVEIGENDREVKNKLDNLIARIKNEKLDLFKDPVKTSVSWLSDEKGVDPQLLGKLTDLAVDDVSPVFLENKDKERSYSFVKVLAIEPKKTLNYNRSKGKVKELYAKHRLAQEFGKVRDRLADLTYTNPDSLEYAAKELDLILKSTTLFTKANAKSIGGILSDDRVVNAVFNDAVLRGRYNSNLIELEPGRIIVLRIKEYVPERFKVLDEVRSSIIAELTYDRSVAAAEDFANNLLVELEKGTSETELASKYQLVWKKSTGVGIDLYTKKDKIIQKIFDLPNPNDGGAGKSLSVEKKGDGFMVIRLNKVYYVDHKYEKGELDKIIAFFGNAYGYYDYHNLLRLLGSRIKVKVVTSFDKETQ